MNNKSIILDYAEKTWENPLQEQHIFSVFSLENPNFSQESNQSPNGLKTKAAPISTEFEPSFCIFYFPIHTSMNYYLIFAL